MKNCATSLCEPITFLYIQCLQFGYLPQEWRTHCITPIYKSGDKAIVSNYHPISLLCIISKILEKIVYKYTMSFLSDYFTKHQFGFIPGCSSLQQLLLYINNLIMAKEDSCQVDTIYVDFKKAFDTVPHTTLLNKLQDYRITGDVFNFYKAYLSNVFNVLMLMEFCLTFYLFYLVFHREVYWGHFSLLCMSMTCPMFFCTLYLLCLLMTLNV